MTRPTPLYLIPPENRVLRVESPDCAEFQLDDRVRAYAFSSGVAGSSVVSSVTPSPLNISGLFGSSSGFWLDFTDGGTVFSNVGGSTPATPGATMRSVRSKAPSADLFAVDPAQDWPWTADSYGVYCPNLDGTKNWLVGYGFPLGSGSVAWTQVALFTHNSGSSRSIVDSDIVGQRTFQGLIVNGSGYYQLFKPSNVVGDVIGIGAVSSGALAVTSARISQAAYSTRVNGVQVAAGALTHALPSGYSAYIIIAGASLSSGGSTLNRFSGRLYGVMMINRYLTDVEVASVENEMLRAALRL